MLSLGCGYITYLHSTFDENTNSAEQKSQSYKIWRFKTSCVRIMKNTACTSTAMICWLKGSYPYLDTSQIYGCLRKWVETSRSFSMWLFDTTLRPTAGTWEPVGLEHCNKKTDHQHRGNITGLITGKADKIRFDSVYADFSLPKCVSCI